MPCILIYLIYFWCVSGFQNHAGHLFLLFLFILDVYPYKYMGSFERFNEDQLLPKEAFYNSLKNQSISDEDYAYAQDIFRSFLIVDFDYYHIRTFS